MTKKKLMPVRHLWSVMAKEASIDQTSNAASLFGIVEELRMKLNDEGKEQIVKNGLTMVQFQSPFQLVSLFHSGDTHESRESFEVRVVVIDPTGKQLGEFTNRIETQGKKRARALMELQGLPVSVWGEYWFVFSIRDEGGSWEKTFELPLEVFEAV